MVRHLHPDPRIQRMLDWGGDGRDKVCSAGRSGYHLTVDGDYTSCVPMAYEGAIGNVLRDGVFAQFPLDQMLCPVFPPDHPDRFPSPVPEVSCWCAENTVVPFDPAAPNEYVERYWQEHGVDKEVFISWEVSRLCNLSCNYCSVPAELFAARHDKSTLRTSFLETSQLLQIADVLLSQFERIRLRLTGPMEPLTVPGIVDLFARLARSKDNISQIVFMTNFSLHEKMKRILEMGWERKLRVVVSMHFLDDKYDPFKVAELYQFGLDNHVWMDCHVVPSPDIVRFWRPYVEFFALKGVRIRTVPYIAERSDGSSTTKYSHPSDWKPRHYDEVSRYVAQAKTDAANAGSLASIEKTLSANAPGDEFYELSRHGELKSSA